MADDIGNVTAADVVRDAMTKDLAPEARAAWLEDAAASFRRHGFIVIRNAIPRPAIEAVLRDFQRRHDNYMAPGQKKLYRSFQSDPRRGQPPVPLDGPLANPEVFAPDSALALARKLMGDDVTIAETGAVISHAGAAPQETHRNSKFLFGGLEAERDLPPFAISMLAPLTDVSLDMGPTEFWVGSHRILDDEAATARPPMRMPLSAGTVTMHDQRLFHRGGAHVAGPVRPVFYIGFQREWHVVKNGYDHKPQVRITPAMLKRIPEEYHPLLLWALHLNRTDSVSEFAYRCIGRIRRRVLALAGR